MEAGLSTLSWIDEKKVAEIEAGMMEAFIPK